MQKASRFRKLLKEKQLHQRLIGFLNYRKNACTQENFEPEMPHEHSPGSSRLKIQKDNELYYLQQRQPSCQPVAPPLAQGVNKFPTPLALSFVKPETRFPAPPPTFPKCSSAPQRHSHLPQASRNALWKLGSSTLFNQGGLPADRLYCTYKITVYTVISQTTSPSSYLLNRVGSGYSLELQLNHSNF